MAQEKGQQPYDLGYIALRVPGFRRNTGCPATQVGHLLYGPLSLVVLKI